MVERKGKRDEKEVQGGVGNKKQEATMKMSISIHVQQTKSHNLFKYCNPVGVANEVEKTLIHNQDE